MDRFGMWATQREEHKERIKKTNKERYGVEIASKSDIVKEKIKKTNNERYGGNSAMSDTKIREKCFKKMKDRKEYKFPSGRIEYVQGYEPQALDILLKKYDENDIVCSNSPTIYYSFNGNKHLHVTDIFIKSENKIIEAKSKWTFEIKEDFPAPLGPDSTVALPLSFDSSSLRPSPVSAEVLRSSYPISG